MKFKTATKEERRKHLKILKWSFLIPLISFGIGFILLIFSDTIISTMLLGFAFIITIPLLFLAIEILVILFNSKHYFYFCLLIIFPLFIWIFYSSNYYPYLKGEIPYEELINIKFSFNKNN